VEEFMFTCSLRILLLLVPLLYNSLASAQQDNPQTQPDQGTIYLNVVVTSKSGSPVTDLPKQDFTLLDNRVPQSISFFKAVSSQQAPVEVILLIDEVNARLETMAYERSQIDKFLRSNGGRLLLPTTFAVFSDSDIYTHPGFTTDGNSLSASLKQEVVSPWRGEDDRIELSLKALKTIAMLEKLRPGRKLVLWISPGWPLLISGHPSSLQQHEMFASIATLSTQLREARITLYSIDPLGLQDIGIRTSAYAAYLKGVSKSEDALPGNLAFQVFAIHSGGLALNSGNDLTALLQQCLADIESFYEISYEPPPADKPDEYHDLEIQLAKPGLTARTLKGYYAQPASSTGATSRTLTPSMRRPV
jgi:VWFA-related protein